jgi:hypothetical protein
VFLEDQEVLEVEHQKIIQVLEVLEIHHPLHLHREMMEVVLGQEVLKVAVVVEVLVLLVRMEDQTLREKEQEMGVMGLPLI